MHFSLSMFGILSDTNDFWSVWISSVLVHAQFWKTHRNQLGRHSQLVSLNYGRLTTECFLLSSMPDLHSPCTVRLGSRDHAWGAEAGSQRTKDDKGRKGLPFKGNSPLPSLGPPPWLPVWEPGNLKAVSPRPGRPTQVHLAASPALPSLNGKPPGRGKSAILLSCELCRSSQ